MDKVPSIILLYIFFFKNNFSFVLKADKML